MIVRFQYSKLGSASYIGHLEMTKLFERTFRRSGVVVKYTEGFNPTVKLNFASPLSVGIESEYEVAEVEIEDESFACFSKLDLPLDIEVTVYKPVEKGSPLMSRLAYSTYALYPTCSPETTTKSRTAMTEAESPAAKIAWFSEQEEIPFEKRTKKGTKTVNMKDFVKDIRWDDQRRACLVTLVSGNQGSLNPNAFSGILFPDCKVRIRRMFLSDETGVGLY